MSWVLFKANIKSNRFIWLLITGIFCFYFMTIIGMYDPKSSEDMKQLIEMLPPEMLNAMGFTNIGSTLVSYLSGYIYGFLIFLFPMIISIVVNHRLIATHVDKGSMTYLLTTPNSRFKISITQMLFSLFSITLMFVVIFLFSTIVTISLFPGELEIGKYLLLNLYAMSTFYAISGIGFFGSAIANESKQSLGIGVGIPVGFMVIQMMSGSTPKVEWLKYLTLYSLFDPNAVVNSTSFVWIGMSILLIISGGLYSIGIYVFNKKDLYI